MNAPAYLRAASDGTLLGLKLQPRSSTNTVCEALGNELRIKVTAAAVDGAANEALLKLLAKRLYCSRSSIALVRGTTSRHKVVKLLGISLEDAAAKLQSDTKY